MDGVAPGLLVYVFEGVVPNLEPFLLAVAPVKTSSTCEFRTQSRCYYPAELLAEIYFNFLTDLDMPIW